MSSLVDVIEENGNSSAVVKELREAVTATAAATSSEAPPARPAADDSLPEKLRGKSREEIAEMYANLERVNGRMANDLGTQRRLSDQILELKRDRDLHSQQPAPPPKPTVKVDELLDKPTETLGRFVDGRDAELRKQLDQRLAAIEGNMARDSFVRKHGDYEQVGSDPAFQRWVQASSYRMRAANAAYNGDWNAADELMSEFKDRPKTPASAPPQQKKTETNADGIAAARAASLESSSAGGAGTGSAASGKTYRRADLMELRLRNPEQYYAEDFQAEILRAYNENRVK